MAEQQKAKVRLEIGHVLFMDIVAYSKLLVDEQAEVVHELHEIVRNTESVREAEAAGQLLRLPAGDGMALVFSNSAEAPLECAVEISRALRDKPTVPLRMGIHSGPVQHVEDVNAQMSVAGAGINMAQRVMDCGDAGHILLSKRVADDLAQSRQWREYLHELGDCEVKHGVIISLVNFSGDGIGNPAVPGKVTNCQRAKAQPAQARRRVPWQQGLVALLLVATLVLGAILLLRRPSQDRVTAPPSSDAEKSIAVLPFENLSRDPENAFFADGVQDEVLTHLAKIADIKVISRTSVMQYKSGVARNLRQIGQQLGVAHLLEGSVQRAANKVRVIAQLIDARSDAHIWAQTYDRDLADVFAIQSEIAAAIAEQLRAKLSPHEKAALAERPTADLAAFDQYSRAKTLLVTTGMGGSLRKNYSEAVELLNSATARDPSFYAAYCQLVFANDMLYALGYDHTPMRLAAAEGALERAAQLRPDSPETHLARGWHLYYGVRDFKAALGELEIARRGLANDPRVVETTGYILRRQGQHEEGLRALEQAVALDPRNVFVLGQLAFSYEFLRRYQQELVVLDRALEITPDDVSLRTSRAFVQLLWRADTKPLQEFIGRFRAERPNSVSDVADAWLLCALVARDFDAAEDALAALGTGLYWGDGPIKLSRNFGEGVLARAKHDEARAEKAFREARVQQEKIVAQQQEYGPALCVLGLIDAALGNKEAALEEGRRAVQLMPESKDPIESQRLAGYHAVIATWVGEKDLALQQLASAAPKPGAYVITSYGALKLLPFWEPLRGDPRFEQIVASFAPNDAK